MHLVWSMIFAHFTGERLGRSLCSCLRPPVLHAYRFLALALYWQPLIVPVHHATFEIRYMVKAEPRQNGRCRGAAHACATDHDDVLIFIGFNFFGAGW